MNTLSKHLEKCILSTPRNSSAYNSTYWIAPASTTTENILLPLIHLSRFLFRTLFVYDYQFDMVVSSRSIWDRFKRKIRINIVVLDTGDRGSKKWNIGNLDLKEKRTKEVLVSVW